MTEIADHGRHQHHHYYLTCDDFEQLWLRSSGRCEICGVLGRFTPHGMLHIDHNPLLGEWAVRGLLCSRCNTMLGTPGRLTGKEVDAYLAKPWRTEPPERLTRPLDFDPSQFDKVFDAYRKATARHEKAARRLHQGIGVASRTRGKQRGWQTELVNATGLSRERIRQIIAAEESRRVNQ